ncbi:hypothetical protein R1flu_018093 [Riccia fluitans]|uniref:AMP-activated protein kinase glycogen-binding domain-containing protein n=1 Tax=Riccia fluitans TaxID=41844 RepID=A0ABD1ZEU8_9MARC
MRFRDWNPAQARRCFKSGKEEEDKKSRLSSGESCVVDKSTRQRGRWQLRGLGGEDPLPFSPSSSCNSSVIWTDQRRNRSLAGRRADRVRLVVRGSQEAGTSTLLVQDVEFTWKGQGSEVLLTGDFLEWETKVPLEKGPNGFTLKKKLPVGKFAYKFIVDGEWKHSADSPTVPDGIGGLNNEITVAVGTDPVKGAVVTSSESAIQTAPAPAKGEAGEAGTAKPKPKPAAAADDAEKPTPKAAAAKKPAAVTKSLEATMLEDVIPQLTATLEKEEGLTDLSITFEANQLKTSFTKGNVPYCHWAFFPDGTLEGSRGASLTSYGSPPSTLEPFLVDEKKITPELVVFWIRKRLFAQKILSFN